MTNNTVSKGKHGAPLWKTNKLIKATAEKEGKESTISIIKKKNKKTSVSLYRKTVTLILLHMNLLTTENKFKMLVHFQ